MTPRVKGKMRSSARDHSEWYFLQHPLNMKKNYKIIETFSGLESVVKEFEKEKKIAVDLEADSMFHFREKVCLIQMASRQQTVVIDPLKIGNLELLKPLFADKKIIKIFHGADYDVRSLYRDFGIKIKNLFDTQLVSMYLGVKETSLEAVLQERFNVVLNKKYQRKDWSKRPLPKAMIDYAASDAAYLIPLSEILEKELIAKDRLHWIKEECELLSRVRPSLDNNEPLFLNFKGAGRLNSRNLAVLETLLELRKKIAEKKDRPLFKIMQNDTLLKLVSEKPKTKKQLMKTNAVSAKQVKMYGDSLIREIEKALEIPGSELPVYPRKKTPAVNPQVPGRIKILKKWRDQRALILQIDPALLFNKASLYNIAMENPSDMKSMKKIMDLKKWQQKDFGRDIVRVLKNQKR